jgi:hypothetical protein
MASGLLEKQYPNNSPIPNLNRIQMKTQIPKLTSEQKAQILGDAVPQPASDVEARATNPLAGLHTPCANSPRRLISLWDMIRFLNIDAAEAVNRLKLESRKLAAAQEQLGAAGILTASEVNSAFQVLALVTAQSQKFELRQVLTRLTPIGLKLLSGKVTYQVIQDRFEDLLQAMIGDLSEITVVFIPKNKTLYFERDDLFEETFHQSASPALNAEINAAGNCLAADLNTAAVFHLMRAVEIGLRAVARKLRVTVVMGKSRSGHCPINEPTCPLGKRRNVTRKIKLEFAQWQQIIDQIHRKAKALPPARTAPLKDAMSSFYYFKEVWRNDVMHSRKTYDAEKAERVFSQAKEFMRQLALWVPSL